MKISLRSLFIAVIASATALCLPAAETTSPAVVLKVTGSPMVSIDNQTPSPIKAGDKLPQGATITTGPAAEVEFKALEGSATTIKPDSTATLSKLSLTTQGGTITKQTALIDLTAGSVVSRLDHSKKAINDYSIRTPRGIAAARGTIYIVTVTNDGRTIVTVTQGSVEILNTVTGGKTTVEAGKSIIVSADGKESKVIDNNDSSIKVPGKDIKSEQTVEDNNVDLTLPVSPSQP